MRPTSRPRLPAGRPQSDVYAIEANALARTERLAVFLAIDGRSPFYRLSAGPSQPPVCAGEANALARTDQSAVLLANDELGLAYLPLSHNKPSAIVSETPDSYVSGAAPRSDPSWESDVVRASRGSTSWRTSAPIELSREFGPIPAAEQLGIPKGTLTCWLTLLNRASSKASSGSSPSPTNTMRTHCRQAPS